MTRARAALVLGVAVAALAGAALVTGHAAGLGVAADKITLASAEVPTSTTDPGGGDPCPVGSFVPALDACEAVLAPVADVYYTDASTRVNTQTLFVNPHLAGGNPTGNNRQTFVRFDLSGIPSPVTTATLRMVRHTDVPSGRTYAAQPATTAWSETSGARPGVDGPVASASPGSDAVVEWTVTEATEEFVAGTRTNHGWRIQDTANTGNQNTQFRSREYTGDEEDHPRLTVVYPVPAGS